MAELPILPYVERHSNGLNVVHLDTDGISVTAGPRDGEITVVLRLGDFHKKISFEAEAAAHLAACIQAAGDEAMARRRRRQGGEG